MKNIILISLLISCFYSTTTAQLLKKNTLYLNIGSDYHLNKGDVSSTSGITGVLKAHNLPGAKLGIEFYKKSTTGLYLSTGIDYKLTPQKLSIDYKPSEMGFNNSAAFYSETITFTNHYLIPYFHAGYALPINKSSSLDFGFGFNCAIALNGTEMPVKNVALPITRPPYSDLVMTRQSSWGNKYLPGNQGLPLIPLLGIQLVYRSTIAGKKIKVGLDFCSSINSQNNYTVINYFGPNRTDVGKSTFSDRFQSFGLTLGVGI